MNQTLQSSSLDPQGKKAWLIDLDGTLYRARGVKWAMGLELLLLGAPEIKILRPFRQSHEALREELAKNNELEFLPTPFDEQIRRTAQCLSLSEEKVRASVMHWMVERPGKWIHKFARQDLLERIGEFRAQGGKTALVSDYPASKKLEALGATHLFDAVICSGETEGLTRLKPCPDGLQLAARTLQVEPGACLVLGDRLDADGAAAKNAGMDFELVG